MFFLVWVFYHHNTSESISLPDIAHKQELNGLCRTIGRNRKPTICSSIKIQIILTQEHGNKRIRSMISYLPMIMRHCLIVSFKCYPNLELPKRKIAVKHLIKLSWSVGGPVEDCLDC